MPYIQTLSGKHINYTDIQHDDIVIEDIATALSHICRFAGHLPEFYSVAQHSVLVSQLVPAELMTVPCGRCSREFRRPTCLPSSRFALGRLTVCSWPGSMS